MSNETGGKKTAHTFNEKGKKKGKGPLIARAGQKPPLFPSARIRGAIVPPVGEAP